MTYAELGTHQGFRETCSIVCAAACMGTEHALHSVLHMGASREPPFKLVLVLYITSSSLSIIMILEPLAEIHHS